MTGVLEWRTLNVLPDADPLCDSYTVALSWWTRGVGPASRITARIAPLSATSSPVQQRTCRISYEEKAS